MASRLSLLAVSPCLEIPSPTLLTKRDEKRYMAPSGSAGRRTGLVTRSRRWGSCLAARHCIGVPWLLLLSVIQKWVMLCTSGLARSSLAALAVQYHPAVPPCQRGMQQSALPGRLTRHRLSWVAWCKLFLNWDYGFCKSWSLHKFSFGQLIWGFSPLFSKDWLKYSTVLNFE